MNLGLSEKNVIVTGGSGGIGRGLVLCFAEEGANVISASRDVETGRKLEEEAAMAGYSGKVLAVETDVTDRSSVDAMVAACHDNFGKVDILINNAGGVAQPSDAATMSDQDRQWEINLNINGVVNCIQAVAEDLFERGGNIVNISSNSSLLGEAASNVCHYGGVKGFVNSYTKALAWEWADQGVRVNNICPGWIVPYEADQVGRNSFWNRFGFNTMGRPDEMEKALDEGTLYNMSGLPIKRLGRPEDIAWTAMFLASDRAGYLTGQMISVSGGAYMP